MTKRALLSVFDKTGLIDFAQGLLNAGYDLIASGGTARALTDAKLSVTAVEDLTGYPSIFGGRVKTLHPAIHGPILARETEQDRATLKQQGWQPIDLVAVVLYPFAETIAIPGVTWAEAVEQIDVGGVALLRAAAKNHTRITVISCIEDYAPVLAEIEAGGVRAETRQALALKAFSMTAAYDASIAAWFAGESAALPATLSISLPRAQSLRYGENPQQQAAYYAPPSIGPLGAEQLQGKELSYNNLLDIDAAWAAVQDFEEPTVVIVKHLSPCGIASAESLARAFTAALASDPVSAFGGVITVNRSFEADAAQALGDLFVEAIASPDFSPEALEVLSARKNCRLLRMQPLPAPATLIRSVRGGLLAQTPDLAEAAEWRVVTERSPSPSEETALRFAWKACKHVKSNAIVIAQGSATVGIGGGLPSRVDATKLAASKAGERARGAALASDAFFPFPDGPEAAAAAGVTAIVQPGGSVRDDEVIAACDRLGMAMIFAGTRHFRH